MNNIFDVIVVGAGHAGIEASLASSRMGCSTLLVTFRKETIGLMSCNPAIGGIGKGQIVKEIDALGGEMAKAADKTGIQFKVLNRSRGPAVQSSRAQIDMKKYQKLMEETVEIEKNIRITEGEVKEIILDNDAVKGIITTDENIFYCKTLVLCPGTFLNGMLHVGLNNKPGGRTGEPPSNFLGENLKKIGFNIFRFKTGTCPRLDRKTIDFSRLTAQEGDTPPNPFSFSSNTIEQKQVLCHIVYTNRETHELIRNNLDRSPLYTGKIKATGVRYCPSIEDKIIRFPDRERHQIFLEPEGIESDRIYPNGLSTSLPEDVQSRLIHSIEGLEKAEILSFGYGIEYSVIDSTQLYPTLESKLARNLFFAGQINGTTGYEEAAGQGLIAGINAALASKKREKLVLDRSTSYIGALIDDLTTKGTNEPYRMFTSRIEYRLLLREDNADVRLVKKGYECGLLEERIYKNTVHKQQLVQNGIDYLKRKRINPTKEINTTLKKLNTQQIRTPLTLEELLKRTEISLEKINLIEKTDIPNDKKIMKQIELEVKYSGYIKIQLAELEKFRHIEEINVPENIEFRKIPGISNEIREKLEKFKPLNLGQAGRISGMTPAAISILMVYIRKHKKLQLKSASSAI